MAWWSYHRCKNTSETISTLTILEIPHLWYCVNCNRQRLYLTNNILLTALMCHSMYLIYYTQNRKSCDNCENGVLNLFKVRKFGTVMFDIILMLVMLVSLTYSVPNEFPSNSYWLFLLQSLRQREGNSPQYLDWDGDGFSVSPTRWTSQTTVKPLIWDASS